MKKMLTKRRCKKRVLGTKKKRICAINDKRLAVVMKINIEFPTEDD